MLLHPYYFVVTVLFLLSTQATVALLDRHHHQQQHNTKLASSLLRLEPSMRSSRQQQSLVSFLTRLTNNNNNHHHHHCYSKANKSAFILPSATARSFYTGSSLLDHPCHHHRSNSSPIVKARDKAPFAVSSSTTRSSTRGVVTESCLSETELFQLLKNSQQSNKHELLNELMPKIDPKTGKEYTLYEQCVRRLYLTNLFHPVKMGLSNMEALDRELNHPLQQHGIQVIHVAGTNGKGSVCYKLAQTLQCAGYKVGLFVSPHISSFRERMQVNGQMITEAEVETLLPKIYQLCETKDIPATFFEVTTALAFSFFHSRNVDFVVLETGLGGRLDATNIIQNPILTIITSIGLEHTRILGHTIELIAKEKAGIMKPNTPVLVGPDVPHHVLSQCAKQSHAEGYYTTHQPPTHHHHDTAGGGVVDYNEQNNQIVQSALQLLHEKAPQTISKVTPEHIQTGISVRPPCRFEQISILHDNDDDADNAGKKKKKRTVLLDVAHNPDAIKLLVSKLKSEYPQKNQKFRMIVGFSSDKDFHQCVGTILDFLGNDGQYLHLVEAAHPRAAKLEDIIQYNHNNNDSDNNNKNNDWKASVHLNLQDRSVTHQVQQALAMMMEDEKDDELLVVCGSVFLMAEAREALGMDEPKDSKYISEVSGMNLRFGQENFANHDPEEEKDATKLSESH